MPSWALYGMLMLGAMLFVATGYAYTEREGRIAAVARAEHAEKDSQSKARQIEQLTEEARAARQRAARFERIRQDVVSSPNSRACADSPAVRAALRGLYQPPDPAGAGRPDGASRPSAAPR